MGEDRLKAVEVSVRGTVQGVYFRSSAHQEAERLGLCGTVRNRDDGSVQLKLQGAEEQIHAMLEWCAKGPELARVMEVSSQPIQPEGWTSFTILY